ncbi:MAG: hypothetical protein CMQ41_16040 [Gammaproteobacteria bacterium]|nr:hypothetical protein [Gammaproteobacteria bacterium]
MQSLEPADNRFYWVKLSAKQWRDRAFFCLVIVLITMSLPNLATFTNVPSLAIGFGATLLTADVLERLHKIPLSVTLLSLAIPMGIVASTIGLVSIFSSFSSGPANVQAVSIATSIMLLTTYYGLILCVIGYSLNKNDDSYFKPSSVGLKTFLLLISLNYGLIFWGIFQNGNPIVFLSVKPLLLVIGLTVLFHFARAEEKGLAENIADASIASIILSIMIGLVMLYSSFGADPSYEYMGVNQFTELANYANYGLFYGCSLYVFSFLLSLYTNEFQKINFKLKNWHMIEAFSFYVFMTLAAPSLFELV